MHALSLLRGWLLGNCTDIHRARLGALCRLVAGLLQRGTLTLSDLGRAMPGSIRTKHKIKCVDRLLGNRHLHRERSTIYRVMASWLLRGTARPVILVDWSDCTAGHKWLVLKAAVAASGRAISVYDEVHPLSRYNNPGVHRRFLRRLAALLPPGCAPVIVTDAGFRGPWFREVESLGWHYVGRVRNRIRCSLDDGRSWCWTTELYATAGAVTRFLGAALLSHKRPYSTALYLLGRPRRGPGRPRNSHNRGHNARRERRRHKEPWLLATSLPHTARSLAEVPRLYGLRMQIEETFRDLKGKRLGFAAVYARTESVARREVLLLVAALASFVLWLIGLAARAKGWMAQFQANTERRESVLSVVFLAREVLRQSHLHHHLSVADLFAAHTELRQLVQQPAIPT